ncbi:hypothetical protein [Puia sp.]|uniref:hypothetical protein n=1 Tax=Puia sp. TaxID=2045100 RepID=UPI002F407FDC
MKNFLSLKRSHKIRKKRKWIKVAPSGLFKNGETYPLYVSTEPFDETAPYYVKALEEAYRVFEKAPLPEFLQKRAQGIK